MSIHPSLHRTLSRYRRAAAVGAAALLAPALVVACGSPQHPASAAAGDAATRSASASAGATGASPSPDETSATSSPSTTRSPSAAGTTQPSRPSKTSVTPTTPPAGSSPATTPPAKPQPQPPVPGSVLHSTASGGRTVALTFDDGPGPATGPILDLLAQYGAHATFCQVGTNAAADPAMVKRIVAEGHRLCDHTVHHPQPLHAQPHERQQYEISAARDMIVHAAGPGTEVTWWRAPGGDFTAENVAIASELGMKSLGWSVDPRDWARPGVPAIVADVQHHLRPGGVVLMHDGGGDRTQTVEALRQLLPWLVSQGYHFDFPAS